ncbi:hypothetical protein P12x_003051 [Tundrisphaera lichenicola]|uniref:hypothetical protein n=1 Tax=Tundrisphaera lichenicola TaxID=2029860 RepID=UPI003EB6CA59
MSVQFDKIKAILGRHKRLFDLAEGNLGADLCKAATDGCQECLAAEQDPDGNPWPPLSGPYEEWKSFEYPGNPMALLHGVMANPREVAGEIEVAADSATVTYGVSEQARQEAEWFQEGVKRTGQPPRRFWGFTSDSLAKARAILDERFSTV